MACALVANIVTGIQPIVNHNSYDYTWLVHLWRIGIVTGIQITVNHNSYIYDYTWLVHLWRIGIVTGIQPTVNHNSYDSLGLCTCGG